MVRIAKSWLLLLKRIDEYDVPVAKANNNGYYDEIKAQTPLPAYFPYPKFLLQMSLSHTARLTYVLLLDRMTLSQKNGWVDVQGRAYVLYPLAGLAEDLQSSISSVTRALRELEAARLIERRSNGFSKPNQIFLGVPRTAQKCAIEMAQNEQPDCSKVSNTIAQNCIILHGEAFVCCLLFMDLFKYRSAAGFFFAGIYAILIK